MPIYTYECKEKHKTEKIRKMEERKEPIECPYCKEKAELVNSVPSPAQGLPTEKFYPSY